MTQRESPEWTAIWGAARWVTLVRAGNYPGVKMLREPYEDRLESDLAIDVGDINLELAEFDPVLNVPLRLFPYVEIAASKGRRGELA